MSNEVNFTEVTLQDCLDAYTMRGLITVLNDGEVKDIRREREEL